MSDAALNLETNRYLDGMFDQAEAMLAAESERARDALDDRDMFVEVICEWVDFDTFNSLVRAIYTAVDTGQNPDVFCKSLHAHILQSATHMMRKTA